MSKLKQRLLKIAIPLALFVISLFVADVLLNKGSSDMTAEMNGATLPIIYLNVNDEYINPLHGYTMEMEGNYLRGPITPLMANRSIAFRVDLYDAVIAKVSYEVRPTDMSRLIEDTEVTDFKYEGNYIYATANLKDLYEDETEYMLIIKLTTSGGDVIRYYARVINKAELYLGEKISFVRDFSEKALAKDPYTELKQYMESNSEGDNSSFSYVNIHSSYKQLIWGDLIPILHTDKDLEILEIDETTASIKLSYQVMIDEEKYNVSEFFRLLRGKRMYLIEYERIVNHVIDETDGGVVNGKIVHGIINEDIKRIENDNGTIITFVQQNALYSYSIANNTLARLFAFCDENNNDARTIYNAHSIKPLTIDTDGNVRFIVYGYMNRGAHEGQNGVALYYYDAALNTTEEILFIPYAKSNLILEKDIENLSYISPRNRFYILLDGAVYSINLEDLSYEIMQDSISETGFYSSDDESIIAWQSGENITDYTDIQVFKLDSMTPTSINAPAGEIIVPLGFMDRDIVYGLAKISDVTVDETGKTLIPLYSLKIENETGTVLKKYEQNNIYILDVEKQDNMLLLNRVSKDEETGEYIAAPEDQIVNNKTEATLKNKLTSVITEAMETTYQTNLFKEPPEGSIKVTNPREVVIEGSRTIEPENEDNVQRYYVYSAGLLKEIYTNVSDAVIAASDCHGVVVNKAMSYIWESENRKSSVRLENIEESEDSPYEALLSNEESNDDEKPEEDESEEVNQIPPTLYYELCLDVMLKADGVYKNTKQELEGRSLKEVLANNLEADVVDLYGCTLSDALYYVSRGYPVMAVSGRNEALIIVGYDSKNTILFDPVRNSIYKKGLNDSVQLFEKAGNQYITYVK